MERPEAIRNFILKEADKHSSDIVLVTAQQFNVSRTTVHRHLAHLIQSGKITKSGTTKSARYYTTRQIEKKLTFKATPRLDEFNVWATHFDPFFAQFPNNIIDICQYGLTEILNNAKDHAEAKQVKVSSRLEGNTFYLTIQDDGIGAFRKIADYYALTDLREGVLQLSIGKLTTDPNNHTGEGVFFSSRAFDRFTLIANGIKYMRDNGEDDWSLETMPTEKQPGTKVELVISLQSTRHLVDIFKAYQDEETLAFDRTDIIVALSQYGSESFISRSQAKRILHHLDKFQKITLDFRDVRMAGQGFVDEIFRVYQAKHPELEINYVNANEDVEFMLKRCLATIRGPS